MAAAVYTVINVIDEAKSHINDVANGLGVAGDFDGLGASSANDIKLRSIMMDSLANSGEQTLTLQKQTTGLYTYTGGSRALWFANNTTPFTGEDDVSYYVYGVGPKVMVYSGTATATTIEITGAWVNFPAMMADIFFWLADTKSVQIATNIEGESLDPQAIRDALLIQARIWQGVITSDT